MAKFVGFVIVGALSIGLAGCGGSSGSSDSGPAAPLASTWRTVQAGDNWQWNFTLTDSLGTAPGIATESVTDGGDPIQPYLIYTTTYTYKSGYSETDISYLSQDASTHALYYLGDPEGTLASPVLRIPGAWQAGLSFSTSITEPDKSILGRIVTVIGTEVVTVPAGKFVTWKVEITNTSTEGYALTGLYWFAPQIGEVVKQSSTTTYPPGPNASLSHSYSSEMTKTSIVP